MDSMTLGYRLLVGRTFSTPLLMQQEALKIKKPSPCSRVSTLSGTNTWQGEPLMPGRRPD